jgi:hypothetical protein
MGLREQAAADARAILEDRDGGFGWPITLTDPDGEAQAFVGYAGDIGHRIDPETGQTVVGRSATVSLSLEAITDAGMTVPRGIADSSKKPWLVAFEDIGGAPHTFKVVDAMPDRTVGVVVLHLELYKP